MTATSQERSLSGRAALPLLLTSLRHAAANASTDAMPQAPAACLASVLAALGLAPQPSRARGAAR